MLMAQIINFAPFLSGTPAEKHTAAVSVTDAFRNSGFVYLKNHGIAPSMVQKAFTSSARFFARLQDQKDSLCWTTPQSNRGYIATGQEKLTQSGDTAGIRVLKDTNPDLKETMEIGREGVDDLPNRWPDHFDDEGKAFKQTMLSFWDQCRLLHKQIMQAIALAMNLPEHFFDKYIDAGDNTLRLLHYPPVRKDIFQKRLGQVRGGEHSDYGTITILFQDARGGLQVRSPKGTFVDVTPIPDTIIVNTGDLLARWFNDTITSTRHRVVEPPLPAEDIGKGYSDTYPARYSVAYFCNPNMDRFIEALPGTYGGDQKKKYPGIKVIDYLVQRLSATI